MAFLIGLVNDPHVAITRGMTRWSLDVSPFWFGLSLAGYIYLVWSMWRKKMPPPDE